MSEQIIIFSQIVFIDLVLAGDNAIIIGMVASQFQTDQSGKWLCLEHCLDWCIGFLAIDQRRDALSSWL